MILTVADLTNEQMYFVLICVGLDSVAVAIAVAVQTKRTELVLMNWWLFGYSARNLYDDKISCKVFVVAFWQYNSTAAVILLSRTLKNEWFIDWMSGNKCRWSTDNRWNMNNFRVYDTRCAQASTPNSINCWLVTRSTATTAFGLGAGAIRI